MVSNTQKFYGDGDNKSHKSIENVYGEDMKVERLHCVGDIQKRAGNQFRKLRKNVKGISGKGKLTLNIIDRLQNYYGIAIRQNVGDLVGMKNEIFASLFHIASTKKNQWHDHCPKVKNSWCLIQRDKINKTTMYKPDVGLPLSVIAHVKPIYKDLSEDSLLLMCLNGLTQNANESFNAMIWERVPKIRFVGFEKLKFGVLDAVASFNIGSKASLQIMEVLNLIPGNYTTKGCITINNSRLRQAQ